MRLAVSNIAWRESEDDAVERVLHAHGIDAIEAAPSRLFADPQRTPSSIARETALRFRDRGLEIMALQSLLFGIDGLAVFGERVQRERMADALATVVRLAGAMTVPVLVYGSPSTRRVPAGMSAAEAFDSAATFFAPLAGIAADHGTVLCIEPNPPRYGCDFVTTADEGAALVRAIGADGFGLHLDAAGMTLAGDDPASALRDHAHLLRHYHASAPDLGPLEDVVVDHAAAAAALHDSAYARVVSIEMRAAEQGGGAAHVEAALAVAAMHYTAQPNGADR